MGASEIYKNYAVEPSTPTLETAQGISNASEPTKASSIETMTARKIHTPVIVRIIVLCGFASDSTMVRYIEQQGWTEWEHVTLIDVDEVKDFFTVCENGIFEAKPMLIHHCILNAFILYYMRKQQKLFSRFKEDDLLHKRL
jgi:hypothetical protein